MSQFEKDVTTLLVAIAEGQLLLLEQLGRFEHPQEFAHAVEKHREEFDHQITAIHAKLLMDRNHEQPILEDASCKTIASK
jgi:hypothetical protein